MTKKSTLQTIKTGNESLEKREWVYIMDPSDYEVAPCSCGNQKTQWSEYKDHIWCDKCQKDFIPEHFGLFDGPIAINTCKMLGISFDRVDLKTKKVLRFDNNYQPE